MKICIDISQIAFFGGVGEYTKKLVEHLLRIDRTNEYILLVYSLRQKQKFTDFAKTISGYKNFRLKFVSLPVSVIEMAANKWRLLTLEQLVGRVDVYHASDWVQFRSDARIVSTIHDLAPLIFPLYHDKKITEVFKRRLKLAEKCDSLIAVSENTKKDYLSHFNYKAGKIHVIYEAPVISAKGSGKKGLDTPYVLTVSSLNPRKNIKRMIKAFRIFFQTHPDYSLVVVGAFGWGEKFKNEKNISFAGHVAEHELRNIYENAKLFVYPSLYEGFGLPVLEAMSFGVPVVTSNTSSLPEIAGDSAVLVDPGNVKGIVSGMEKALKQKERLKKLGRARAKEFTWEKTARQTLKIYQDLGNNDN